MKKLLLVDDQPHVLRVMQVSLARHGYSVSTAANGAEGLQKYHDEKPDAMIVDIDMPVMNGRELCNAIMVENPQTPLKIFISTGSVLEGLRGWAGQYAQIDFMEKPISISSVVAKLSCYFDDQA